MGDEHKLIAAIEQVRENLDVAQDILYEGKIADAIDYLTLAEDDMERLMKLADECTK